MSRFAHAAGARLATNAKLVLLRGFPDWDRCHNSTEEKDSPETLSACDRAVGVSEYWRFLVERAKVRDRMKNLDGALKKNVDQAIRLRPQFVDARAERAIVLAQMSRWELSGVDQLLGLRVNPAAEVLVNRLPEKMKGLLWEKRSTSMLAVTPTRSA